MPETLSQNVVALRSGEAHNYFYCDIKILALSLTFRVSDRLWTFGDHSSLMILSDCCQANYESSLGQSTSANRWRCSKCKVYNESKFEPFVGFTRTFDDDEQLWTPKASPHLNHRLQASLDIFTSIVWQEELQDYLAAIVTWLYQVKQEQRYVCNDDIMRGLENNKVFRSVAFTLEATV